MNQPEHELGRTIARHLDAGAERLDETTRARLLGARKAALAHYRAAPAAAGVWAWAGGAVERTIDQHPQAWRVFAGAVALAVALAAVTYWQSTTGAANELADIDASILTGDLPINAYLDKGFDSWLKRSSR